MEISQIRALRGPNAWGRFTAIEAEVSAGSIGPIRGELAARLLAQLPGLDLATPVSSHILGEPAPIDAPAHALMRISLALQQAAGCRVANGRTAARAEGRYKLVVEYGEEAVGREALELARQLLVAAAAGESFDARVAIAALQKKDQSIRLGPSTGAIARAAENRGIPTRRLNEGSLVQFGWGSKQRRILAAETDRTSAIGESIAQDKELTKMLLRTVGVAVPDGRPVASAEDAWEAAQEIGVPVVVKPQHGNQGRGVTVNLSTREQVVAAYAAARAEERSVIVEKFVTGDDYRLLVIGDKVVAAALRQPPRVIGDGVRSIEALVAEVNSDPRRGEDHATALSRIELDAIALGVLADQGHTPASIPAAGSTVLLRRSANLSTGGSAIDVTSRVHPDLAARMVDAARVVGLDVAGIDVMCHDVSISLETQGGVVVEVNAAPGLRMHLEPSEGQGQPVGEAIVATLFAPGATGRIPTVAVTGNNGKTTTTRLVAHIFATTGLRTALTCTDGIYVAGRRIDTGDCSGPRSAKAVLMNPTVDAAVLETARGGLLREGLGFDRVDVAIVTNVGEGDHLGISGVETVEQLAWVKGTLAENIGKSGACVLNAADRHTAAIAARCPGTVVLFARDAAHPALAAHLARGGRGVFVRDGAIFLSTGTRAERLAALTEIPLTKGGTIGFQIDNVLAAVAAAWWLDLPRDAVRRALATFDSDAATAPGRFNVLKWGEVTVALDYAHNPDALHALIDAFGTIPHKRRVAVFTAAGDRRDVDIVRQSQILADGFDRIHLYEDACNRGRTPGDIVALMKQGCALGRRSSDVVTADDERHAIETCLRTALPGDILFIQVDQIDDSVAYVEQFIAREPPPTSDAGLARAG